MYLFDDLAGQLRKIDPATGEPGDFSFEFGVMEDNNDYNQRHYEALGEVSKQYLETIIFEILLVTGWIFVFVGYESICL